MYLISEHTFWFTSFRDTFVSAISFRSTPFCVRFRTHFSITSFRRTPFSLSEILVEAVSRSVILTAFQMEVLSSRLLTT